MRGEGRAEEVHGGGVTEGTATGNQSVDGGVERHGLGRGKKVKKSRIVRVRMKDRGLDWTEKRRGKGRE